MAYRILIVDDSTFFRRRITQILQEDAELQVVGEAKNGMEAISLAQSLKPDVITMDVEMPVMDGISAVKKIMALCPVPIIMFSSLTHDGASATLDALDAGAVDFLPKKFEDIALNRKEATLLLQQRVKTLARKNPNVHSSVVKRSFTDRFEPRQSLSSLSSRNDQHDKYSHPSYPSHASKKSYKCLAIGTSTGGPVALQKILVDLPSSFPYPIIMVQHMPAAFTEAFANRLNDLCNITVKEAKNGDLLSPGTAYLAPGGCQMLVEGRPSSAHIRIVDADRYSDITYKPSVDITFRSLSSVFGGDVLGVILTGMGADGREGCRELKLLGAKIWAQDEKSSVVYGMPQAVTVANIAEQNYDIEHMSQQIKSEMLN
ncbi:protein-glutamate methylesterase/protein-glutamine glutaminase [Flavobacterium sp. W21_SRS_FM6]|uniref:protein-glutamate methylesterase/protein-glutamine glutaminase n=1 Tax=Flavobacterium sp. W21_SRS_FM6 TaxID=3240268 RepID=UPI003F8DCB94